MTAHTNAYATDGKCHNVEPGTFNHECGRPAVWIGVDRNGFAMGFCDGCKGEGHEARACVSWERIAPSNVANTRAIMLRASRYWDVTGCERTIDGIREDDQERRSGAPVDLLIVDLLRRGEALCRLDTGETIVTKMSNLDMPIARQPRDGTS